MVEDDHGEETNRNGDDGVRRKQEHEPHRQVDEKNHQRLSSAAQQNVLQKIDC